MIRKYDTTDVFYPVYVWNKSWTNKRTKSVQLWRISRRPVSGMESYHAVGGGAGGGGGVKDLNLMHTDFRAPPQPLLPPPSGLEGLLSAWKRFSDRGASVKRE